MGPFSLFFPLPNKTGLLLAEARAIVSIKSRAAARGEGVAVQLFCPSPPPPLEALVRGFSAYTMPRTGSSRFCSWQYPPLAAHTQGAQHGCPPIVPFHIHTHQGHRSYCFATALGKMSHGHFACPQRGDSATLAAATPAPLLRCLAYQQAPSCDELGFASLQPLAAAAAASCRGLAPCTQGWKELGSRCCSQLPCPVPAGALLPAWSWNIEARVSCACLRALLLPGQLINADNGGLGLLLQQGRRSPCPASLRVAFPCRIWGRGTVKQNLQLPRGWGSFFHSHASVYCSP